GGHGVLGCRPEDQRGNPGKRALRLIEEEAESIRLVIAMRDQGMTLQKFAGELNAQGFRTKAGAEFSHVQVWRVLNREAFYRGQGVITRSVEGGASGAHSAILLASSDKKNHCPI
ncbi:MAG: recombinase family protein, partial [Fimbriimonadaceae bacterium]|nr:recombinase family protein [Fimbriimonadaceae bacterium]